MKLNKLINTKIELDIEALMVDSRTPAKNAIFFCVKGMKNDGHNFIDQAIDHGAICIIHSCDLRLYKPFIEYIKVNDVLSELTRILPIFYNKPSSKIDIFGITGTNGKSTIAKTIQYLINQDHKHCGYIGTISIDYANFVCEPDFTTPDPIKIHDILKDMLEHEVTHLALEVSSQGLDQGRVDALRFKTAIFTNLTHDHLDYHGTMESYYLAKKHIFDLLDHDGSAIINIDDPYGNRLLKELSTKKISYGIEHPADYFAKQIEFRNNHTEFTLVFKKQEFKVKTNLLALFNIYNLLAVIAACHCRGMSLETIIPLLSTIPQIEGRMEMILEGQNFNCIIDYAHTPDGFEKIFTYAKTITSNKSKIIVVFGTAGHRDTKKRPILGAIAEKYCSMIIITEEDPRTESPLEIAKEVASGIKTGVYSIVVDRYDAIRQSLEMANQGDTVLILGLGVQKYMYRKYGKERYTGDDVIVKELIHSVILP